MKPPPTRRKAPPPRVKPPPPRLPRGEAAATDAAASTEAAATDAASTEAAATDAAAAAAPTFVAAPRDGRLGVPAPSLYVGISGGGHFVLTDWDFTEIDGEGRHVSPESGPLGKLRIGFQVAERIALEAAVGHFAFDAATETNPGMIYEADLLLFLANEDPWSGFLTLGAGLYHNLSPDPDGTDESEADFQAHIGLGTKIRLADWLWLRGEGRYYITDSLDPDLPIASNVEASLGFDFMLWGPDEGPKDTDGDTFTDDVDACPTVFGHDTAKGCPDRDRDGIVDSEDKCPDAAGPAEHQGCPDRDGDGIIDDADKCPDQPGKPELDGCPEVAPPDRDGDGIPDDKDLCPDQPEDMDGIEDANGCPEEDADQDGILDAADKCPLRKETVNGFEDTDGCPDEVPAPTVVITCERFELNESIYFDLGKYTIQARSFPILDKVAEALNANAFVKKIRIEGHTDSQGSDAFNLTLSRNRAKAVLDYLAKKGVSRKRMDSQGYGETRPIASNEEETGRAQNRRVDFIIVEQEKRENCVEVPVGSTPTAVTPAAPQ
ncbi:MAG: OmpA family protein [Myxococcales bacterium]|nr:OmpA family protein [Myxococcales bacterium]